jgi:N-acetylated-alpha-linked acidic dipeptidase
MAERIGGPKPGVGALAPPGDPTLPGEAPLPGKKHLAWEQTDHSDIPEINVTQAVARTLLAGMTGPVVPDGWHGGFEMVEHVGGNQSVHLAVKMDRHLITIWNVIGTLKGAKRPDQIVMIGSHRDAMAFGAIDPGSGTTVMMQDADGFKKLLDEGWHPDRTIQIASWDGHELGLYGSLSLAYARGPELRKHVVQYINTDQLTTGLPYVAAMSPELWAFGREIGAYVKGGDGKPLIAAATEKKPFTYPPGGGSDHMTFIYELGVPGSTTGYYGHFGAHHSAEDNIAGLETYDPGLKEAVATAQFTGVQAMRAAGAVDMPLRLTDVAQQLVKDVDAARKNPQYSDIDFKALRETTASYADAAKSFDAKLLAAERSGDPAALDMLEQKAMVARDVFWMPDGLSYNKYWHTIDRYVAAFPELNYASFETTGKDAKVATALGRLEAAIEKATVTIK